MQSWKMKDEIWKDGTTTLCISLCSNMLALLGSEKSCDLKPCFKVRELCWGLPRAAMTIVLPNQVWGKTEVHRKMWKVWSEKPVLEENAAQWIHLSTNVWTTAINAIKFNKPIGIHLMHLPISVYTYLHFKQARRQSLRHATRKAFSITAFNL